MVMKKKVKRKIHKTSDPTYNTHTYPTVSDGGKIPFDIEWMKYYNPREGRDQIMFLYVDKVTKEPVKYRVMR